MTLKIECDEPEVTVCECCGNESLNLFRTIRDGEVEVAYYLATLPEQVGVPVTVLLIVGRFDEDAPREERFSMTFKIVHQADGFGTGIVDPADAGWEETHLAVMLSKEQARSRFSKQIFAYSDLILEADPVIRAYLEASITNNGPPPTHH